MRSYLDLLVQVGFVVLSSVGAHPRRSEWPRRMNGRRSRTIRFNSVQTSRLCCSDSRRALTRHPNYCRFHPLIHRKNLLLKHREYDSFGNIVHETNRGDFHGDGPIDGDDIDYLFAHINTKYDPDLDLNGDGVANQADVDLLVEGIIETAYGDADLNGVVDGADFLTWNANRFTSGTGWDQADYDGNGTTDGLDFLIWSHNSNVGDGIAVTTVAEHIFGFTGRMFDDATGLQNNLNRWYDAKVGRWISKDPIGFAAGDANLYRYVGNRVTNATDPSGLVEGLPSGPDQLPGFRDFLKPGNQSPAPDNVTSEQMRNYMDAVRKKYKNVYKKDPCRYKKAIETMLEREKIIKRELWRRWRVRTMGGAWRIIRIGGQLIRLPVIIIVTPLPADPSKPQVA